MIDRMVIIRKLNELNKYLQQLRKYEGVDKEELENNLDKLWIVERGLQLCIQVILDIGNHVVSEKGVVVEQYSDIFKELIKQGVISENYGNRIRGMAGFRNILVHEYADVDIEILVEVLNNSLSDFEQFALYINNYIET
ncbi:DUF86 domain-containing protein [Halocella sp. SP3-1]|uniref:type VII toxin-antitoxin system HepT family RNase toxin n=1 Tax=Halocella sp. SP3-1 TaxID=2382161 RepID=UPI000F756EC6|nr:DUF86 domain-containing protein [Halocella sp. SP3-1]AZO93468.1 DUF86 domain-containing protein [Halocella sp. SP3-1]